MASQSLLRRALQPFLRFSHAGDKPHMYMGLLGTACLSVHSRRRGSGREVQGVAVLGEDRRQSASISHARRGDRSWAF